MLWKLKGEYGATAHSRISYSLGDMNYVLSSLYNTRQASRTPSKFNLQLTPRIWPFPPHPAMPIHFAVGLVLQKEALMQLNSQFPSCALL